MSVQFLGTGDLTVELGDAGEPLRYLWRTDENSASHLGSCPGSPKGAVESDGFVLEGVLGRRRKRPGLESPREGDCRLDSGEQNGYPGPLKGARGCSPMGMRPLAHKRAPNGLPAAAGVSPQPFVTKPLTVRSVDRGWYVSCIPRPKTRSVGEVHAFPLEPGKRS